MAKSDNLGAGLPRDLFQAIVGQLSGGGAKGTPQEQAAVFQQLAAEEHNALHPGKGTTSTADALLKYLAIAQAAQALADAPGGAGPAQTAAIAKLALAIQTLGKQWANFGPVGDAFLDSEEP
jgi:hypothetical protein